MRDFCRIVKVSEIEQYNNGPIKYNDNIILVIKEWFMKNYGYVPNGLTYSFVVGSDEIIIYTI